jgi:hypothetical protein
MRQTQPERVKVRVEVKVKVRGNLEVISSDQDNN